MSLILSGLGGRVLADLAPEPLGGDTGVALIVAVVVGAVVAAVIVWSLRRKKK